MPASVSATLATVSTISPAVPMTSPPGPCRAPRGRARRLLESHYFLFDDALTVMFVRGPIVVRQMTDTVPSGCGPRCWGVPRGWVYSPAAHTRSKADLARHRVPPCSAHVVQLRCGWRSRLD